MFYLVVVFSILYFVVAMTQHVALPGCHSLWTVTGIFAWLRFIIDDLLFYYHMMKSMAFDGVAGTGSQLITTTGVLDSYHEYDSIDHISSNPEALVILIHGMFGSVHSWGKYVNAIRKSYGNRVAIFIPSVDRYLEVDESIIAAPILDVAKRFVTHNPEAHVFVIGHSKGGCIAYYVEQRIESQHVTLLSFAAPHNGTKLAALPKLLYFCYYRFDKRKIPQWVHGIEYDGYLKKDGQTVEAFNGRADLNEIAR